MIFSFTLFYSGINLLLGGEDIRISSISDSEDGAVEMFSTSSSKSRVISIVMVDIGLSEHSKVFNLRSAKRRTVIANEDHLRLRSAHTLD